MNVAAHKIALDLNDRQHGWLFASIAARVAFNRALEDFREDLDANEWRGDKTLRPRFNAVKRERYSWMRDLSARTSRRTP